MDKIYSDSAGRTHWHGLDAETRPAGQVHGSTYTITDGNGGVEIYRGSVAGWKKKSSHGADQVIQQDNAGNILGGAFTLGDQGSNLTGTASSQRQSLPAGTNYVRFAVTTANCQIKFGDSSVTVTASTGSTFVAGAPPEIIQVPDGATDFAFIGNTSVINWTPQ